MKGITLTTITLLFLLAFTNSCYIDLNDDHLFEPVVDGSGRIITEDRLVADFDKILVEGSANVILRQGDDQSVEIEADDNIIPIISTNVRGGELRIENEQRYRTNHGVNVYITIPVVSRLSIQGSGNLFGENPLAGDQLEVDISGSGNMDLEMYYTRLSVEGDGSGDFQMFGEVEEQEIKISGSGNYRARDLTSQNCYIKISGSGRGEVKVSDLLDVEIRGSGDIIYYGNPEVRSSIRGSGDLIKG